MSPIDGAAPAFGVESPLYVAIRFVQFLSVMLLIGAVVFRAAILPDFLNSAPPTNTDTRDRLQVRVVSWAAGALVVFAAIQFARLAAQHVAFFERALPTVETLRALVLESGWGHAWMMALGASVLAGIGLSRIRQDRRQGWTLLGLSGVVMAWTMARSGHPAAAARGAELIDVLHVVGAGGWIGGLWMVCIVAMPMLLRFTDDGAHRDVARLVGAFSPVALCCAAMLAITGLLAAWRNVGGWAPLLESTYGQWLLRKVALVLAMAGIGALNWKRVLPTLGAPKATHMLRRTAYLELSLALAVVMVTAVLVATEMPE